METLKKEIYAIETKETFIKKGSVWILSETEIQNVTKEHFNNATSVKTQQFFKSLGGKETFKNNISISVNPDNTVKVIRSYNFNMGEVN